MREARMLLRALGVERAVVEDVRWEEVAVVVAVHVRAVTLVAIRRRPVRSSAYVAAT
jgi:hypothetical protein